MKCNFQLSIIRKLVYFMFENVDIDMIYLLHIMYLYLSCRYFFLNMNHVVLCNRPSHIPLHDVICIFLYFDSIYDSEHTTFFVIFFPIIIAIRQKHNDRFE